MTAIENKVRQSRNQSQIGKFILKKINYGINLKRIENQAEKLISSYFRLRESDKILLHVKDKTTKIFIC